MKTQPKTSKPLPPNSPEPTPESQEKQSKPAPKKKAARKKKRSQTTKTAEVAPRRYLISDLCEILETYLEPDDIKDVYQAYLFGSEAHNGQTRRSGEPYIHHPLEVAHNLATMHLDARSIVAAILHDVIEDTENSKEKIAVEFGEDVAELVDGVSKISQIEFSSKEEEQAENFRKMLLAMTRDIRVILIKLADRLHNMRTLEHMPRHKQRAIARETLDIYAPIANRLGVRQWAIELEELAFGMLYPLRHRVLAESIAKRHGNRKAVVDKVKAGIVDRLNEEGVAADVHGREKHIYSTYRKMRQKHLSFEQVLDVYAFRIVVDSVDACYRVLGIVHNLYKPIPGRFKDYIAIPKANGYQSLHTVVFGPFGVSIEVQIRTEQMHRVAEAGVAAHWLYKTTDTSDKHAHQRALQWLQDLLEMQQKAGNPGEFLEHLKVDLFPDEVYVFTPNGEIKKLPRGATVIDFAYDVHTDVGNHCLGARIDHRLVPLRTQLRNGNHVEILTSDWSRPNPSWLDYVVTGKARANIRNYLKHQQAGEAVSLGERMLDKALESLGSSLDKLEKGQKQELFKMLKLKSWNDVLGEIGLGNRQAALVARQLLPDAVASKKTPEPINDDGALAITGTEGVVVTYAKCCRPIPGDPIIGFLSAGRGIVVHTEGCPNVAEYRKHPERWIDVHWEKQIEGSFPVNIRIDTRNQRGVLANVASAISEQEANIDSVSFEERDGQTTSMYFVIEVQDRDHLAQIMRAVRNKDTVIKVTRTRG